MTEVVRSQRREYVQGLHLGLSQARNQGRSATAAALKALKDALDQCNAELGPDDQLTLRVRVTYEATLSQRRAATESLAAWRDLVDDCERCLPMADEVFRMARLLEVMYTRRAGHFDDGVAMYQDELELRERLFGAESSKAGTIRQNLAMALRDRSSASDLTAAAELTGHETKRRTEALGLEHPSTWVSQIAMATIYLAQAESSGHLDEELPTKAFAIAEDVAAKRRQRLGPTHPSTLAAERIAAQALMALGQDERAAWRLRKVAAYERVARVDATGATSLLLSRALSKSTLPQDRIEAQRVKQEALEQIDRMFGDRSRQLVRGSSLLPALEDEVRNPEAVDDIEPVA